jgi:hypothetical protein
VEKAPQPEDATGDKAEIWNYQMENSKNICRNLYMGFQYKYRHYQIFLFLQKMLVVALSIFGFAFPDKILIVFMCFYLIFGLISLVLRPYFSKFSNALEVTCFCLNVIATGFGIAVSYGIYIPSYSWIILGIVEFGIPVVFLIAEVISGCKKSIREKKALKAAGQKRKKMSNQDKQMFKAIDSELNSYSVRKIVEYFLVLGLACFLSIAITTVGIIRSTTNSNILSNSIPVLTAEQGIDAIAKYEFAGYANWTDFTSNCCCEYKNIYTNGTLNSDVVEIWKCLPNDFSADFGGPSTQLYKRKRRVSSAGNGLLLRDYCSPTFNTLAGQTCGVPYYNSTFGRYTVNDCSPSRNMTSDILKDLW